MQLWYLRADFDVAVGQLKNSDIVKNYVEMVKNHPKEGIMGGSGEMIQNNKDFPISKYGLTGDPFDTRPFEIEPRCYYCRQPFSFKS
mmetsp:Transcript_22811/g.17264  ORF Transcript_22811/g.17264 Transcript_22811/m.17264 type:complete len:87 (+) Transcript_22811:1468-1728(+)|eukprot:CAMPEP_0202968164 /NCGR_PEP_ID=MMETSP1396-20130829/13330_1 /ASSEMBLY_ACC=CAM_ASM_000872 /TAXON_ID= /ORGANISM="Pseudokeronopsis sp., Strain Brazil" /LENGTH=86 /DNA_ID=CAMNT_0049694137 /DNA_START=547 /DNA_END=807 /DNA_ORIENTATION=+